MISIPVSVILLFGFALTAAGSQPPEAALWNVDGTAAVTATPEVSSTRVTAFLKQQDGTFLEVDLSGVENANVSKLGRRRAEYDRVETTAIEWIPRQDDVFQVRIQTRAWRAAQRYTVSEMLILLRDGTVLWR